MSDLVNPPIDPVAPDEAEAAESDPDIPLPLAKPAEIAHPAKGPIAIFISRKKQRIYVRQDFAPLFDAPISIEHPDQPLGTHVFTAMNYADDGASFRWNVISLPGEQTKARQPDYLQRNGQYIIVKHETVRNREPVVEAPTETPQQALARVEIPQDVLDQISELIVPGSSLIVSDQGLGEETGEGTNFIVVTP